MAVSAAVEPHPIYLAGRWVESPDRLVVDNPADPATPAGATYSATEAQYEEAVTAAVAAFETTRTLPAYERGRILREISAGIKARREELGVIMAREAGKPIRDALVGGPCRDHPALPGWAGRGNQPVQLPAEPRRAQALPGDRGRLLDRPQA